MTMETIKIGIIGLDTSHAAAFTELLNNKEHPYNVKGGKVVAAYPGGSADFELSHSRVQGFTEKLRDEFKVQIMDSIEKVVELSDAILLESVDGRVHLEQFKRVAPYGKPVFIDKPFTVNSQEAREIFAIAEKFSISIMSCSSLRYAEGLTQALSNIEKGELIGVDCYGPMAIQPTQPGLFWYGIHTVEMLFSAMGPDCQKVITITTEDHDLVVGTWADGRVGTIRGNRKGNQKFGALLHREQGSQFADVYAHPKPYYASLLEKIMVMFTDGQPDIEAKETVEIIRFIEAANESRQTGKMVNL
jgi:hypothetical protein